VSSTATGCITTDTREPPKLRDMMRGDILSVYPQLGDIRIDHAWAGIMGYAPHKMPQVGEIEPGLWVCSAFGGHGVAQTAAGADAVTAGIVGEDDRWKLFRPFGMGWAGGPVGSAAAQVAYWSLQARDWWDEMRQARNAETLRT
jgi:glycine/D-amino acid oxidase-like deaminating enzyme